MARKGFKRGEIVIYKAGKVIDLRIKLEKDSVWLSLEQIASLFERDKSVISRHIKNIFSTDELQRDSVVAKNATTGPDGKTYMVEYFNLDVIISIGYRVNSKKATQFRIWATRVLKNHLLKGYTVNEQLLLSQRTKFKGLQTTIDYLENQAKHDLLRGQGLELLALIKDYTKSLNLLEQYDNKKIVSKRGKKESKTLTISFTENVIEKVENSLAESGKALGVFGVDTGKKLESIIKNLNQTFSGSDLYPTFEDKSANLLYLVIKDHPFLDGNKRIASVLFISFLDLNNSLYRPSGERKINDNALVALALLVAISPSLEKDLIIDLIKSLLN